MLPDLGIVLHHLIYAGKSSQVEAFDYKDMTCVTTHLQNKRLIGTREALQLCQGLSPHLLYQLGRDCYVTEQ